MTTVVNLRNPHAAYDVYCGRPNASRGLAGSIFSNQFRVGHDGVTSKRDAVRRHREWLFGPSEEAARIRELAKRKLKDKRLGCWCDPEPCHCENYVDLCDNDAHLS